MCGGQQRGSGEMVICADARALPLRDGCVQCVVTSPPYFGLRDYGTATWEGGDVRCLHPVPATGSTQNKANNNREGTPFRGDCGLCGAQRVDRQLGLEATPAAYVAALVSVFREVRRVLTPDGVCWVNLGDSYSSNSTSGRKDTNSALRRGRTPAGPIIPRPVPDGWKSKDLCGIPWRVALALQADGWYLRADIIWSKPNPMPESVTDRPTKAHEYLFLLSKNERYYYDAAAIRESLCESSIERVAYGWRTNRMNVSGSLARGETVTTELSRMGARFAPDAGRNKRSVWTIPTEPYAEAHFATFPEALVTPCILAGSRFGDRVCDPFLGSGTVGAVAERLGRRWVGTDLTYHDLARVRTAQRGLRFEGIA
jgi:DNA modification methylase